MAVCSEILNNSSFLAYRLASESITDSFGFVATFSTLTFLGDSFAGLVYSY